MEKERDGEERDGEGEGWGGEGWRRREMEKERDGKGERWKRREMEKERDGGGEGGIRAYLSSSDGGRLGVEKRDQTRISRG